MACSLGAVMGDIEIILLPYAVAGGNSLLHRLIAELGKPDWTELRWRWHLPNSLGITISYSALVGFAQRGGKIHLTFGADAFKGEDRGSEYLAVETLLETLGKQEGVTICLYHEKGRTFHPKLYLFSNEEGKKALVIVGSSNWSEGGFIQNVEADLLARLDLTNQEQMACYQKIVDCFDKYWSQQ